MKTLLAAVGCAVLLGGCAAGPYYSYDYAQPYAYGYDDGPYYYGPGYYMYAPAFGFSYYSGGDWHGHDWHGHDHHGDWHHSADHGAARWHASGNGGASHWTSHRSTPQRIVRARTANTRSHVTPRSIARSTDGHTS